MPSERVQRRIDRLLDEAEEAADQSDWAGVRERANRVLVADPDNEDARVFLEMADGGGDASASVAPEGVGGIESALRGPQDTFDASPSVDALPASFANGRYEVKKKSSAKAARRRSISRMT